MENKTAPSRQFLITQAVLTGASAMRNKLFIQFNSLHEWLEFWTHGAAVVPPGLLDHITEAYRDLASKYNAPEYDGFGHRL